MDLAYFYLHCFFWQWSTGQRDGLIFLIDVTKPMFQKDDDEETNPFELCIKVILMYLLKECFIGRIDFS